MCVCVCLFVTSSYPAALLLGAVGVAVQAGEDRARRHQLAGLVPAVCVTQSGGVALTLLVQDGVQPGGRREGLHMCHTKSIKPLLSSVQQLRKLLYNYCMKLEFLASPQSSECQI